MSTLSEGFHDPCEISLVMIKTKFREKTTRRALALNIYVVGKCVESGLTLSASQLKLGVELVT